MFLKRQHLNDSEVGTKIQRRCPIESLSSIAHNNGNIEPPRNDPPNSPSFDILHIDHNSLKLLCLSNAAITSSSLYLQTHEPLICNLDNSDLLRKSSTNSKNVKSFSDQIHALLVRHISHVTKNFTTELLEILREDGHIELPKSAATLLKSANYKEKKIKRMKAKSHRDKEYGYYVYFGIVENLKRIISPTVYNKTVIKLLINIDGIPVFNHSNQQLWHILMLVFDPDYESTPFMVAAFCGKSKPNSVNKFLKECITEIKELVKDGINIEKVHFTVEILGFVCDTPARSFLKCCKGHGGFYACERCEIKGISIKNPQGNTRI